MEVVVFHRYTRYLITHTQSSRAATLLGLLDTEIMRYDPSKSWALTQIDKASHSGRQSPAKSLQELRIYIELYNE
jgi:hypothetical protein